MNMNEFMENENSSVSSSQGSRCNFCTLGSKEYTLRVLALYSSLREKCPNFHLWICCLDEDIYSIIKGLNLGDVTLFKVNEIETPDLLNAKKLRKKNEYCWTLKPFIIKHIIDNYSVQALVYCDGDMFFFSDPTPIFNLLLANSILLCPQRDLEWVHKLYGYYQAGFVGFNTTKDGLNAVKWWCQRCLEWCFITAEPEHERFGDQKYLDKMPQLFNHVYICENLGVDAAPWNSIYNNNYNIYMKGNEVYIEDFKLVCFHFACFSIINENEYDLWTFDKLSIRDVIKDNIYIVYIQRLQKIINYLKDHSKIDVKSLFSNDSPQKAKTYFKFNNTGVITNIITTVTEDVKPNVNIKVNEDITSNVNVQVNEDITSNVNVQVSKDKAKDLQKPMDNTKKKEQSIYSSKSIYNYKER